MVKYVCQGLVVWGECIYEFIHASLSDFAAPRLNVGIEAFEKSRYSTSRAEGTPGVVAKAIAVAVRLAVCAPGEED